MTERSGTGACLCLLRWRGGAATALVVVLGATIFWPPRPFLLWNASASAPRGLYVIGSPSAVRRGDMVVAWPPEFARSLAAERRYLPANVPLVKRVAAGQQDVVCAVGRSIFVNGRHLADRRTRDLSGRLMPWWTGCRRLGQDAFFLLMGDSPVSFDGRYFGVTKARDIVGKATLLWAR